MGRAPCCERMGLKKGPWTPEEDLILIDYINAHGHTNWRALPKQAGLPRCGKSCRLRWTNYLRPDIKRGNFTREEEDTVIELHQMLGNRWSAIAAKLPGRTDNEIKNVWHTHLKKRLQQQPQQHQHQHQRSHDTKRKRKPEQTKSKQEQEPVNVNFPTNEHDHDHDHVNIVMIKSESADTDHQRRPLSPLQCSSSDVSTLTTSHDYSNITTNNDHDMSINNNNDDAECLDDDSNNLALDEDFWSEVLSADNSDEKSDFPAINDKQLQFPFSPLLVTQQGVHDLASSSSICDNDMDFWYDVYTRADGLMDQLPEL